MNLKDCKAHKNPSAALDAKTFRTLLETFNRTGYLIFPALLSDSEIDLQRDAINKILSSNPYGRNEFEGHRTRRIYAMLAKSAVFERLICHPLALQFAREELGPSCLLSACLAIQLEPGETAQPWHYDDAHLSIPRPRTAYGLSTFWALDETTDSNGATEIIPGSHLWGDTPPPGALEPQHFNANGTPHGALEEGSHGMPEGAIKVSMPAGSLMIAKGTLWHRGGANQSDRSRLIVTPQYCPGWARPLENMLLAVPPSKAQSLSTTTQALLGYDIHPPFMGYVDGRHPARCLQQPLSGSDESSTS